MELNFLDLKNNIKFLSKNRLWELFLAFIDEYEDISSEKELLSKECDNLTQNGKT